MIRGWMGISLVPPTQEDVLQPRQTGVVVADVLKNGPAAQAGIKVGDRIVKVNQEDINSTSHLINYVALQAPETTVQVEVMRGEQKVDLTVKVGERKVQNSDSQYIPLPQR